MNVLKRLYNKHLLYCLSFLIMIQCFLTMSRTGILSIIVCFVLLYIYRNKSLLFLVIPVGGIITFLGTTIKMQFENIDSDSSFARFRILETAFKLWRENALFGMGNGAFYQKSIDYLGMNWTIMNTFVTQLVEFGLIGLSLYSIYFIIIIIQTNHFKNITRKGPFSLEKFCVFLATVSWLMLSYSLDTFSKVLPWLFPALLVSVILPNEERKEYK